MGVWCGFNAIDLCDYRVELEDTAKAIELVMAFGVGVLISAVSFELVDEAVRLDGHRSVIACGFGVVYWLSQLA